ncbi:MAG: hypothetical protein NTV68_00115 [Methanomicrobiales archaeon]|nr:hypothetical protein [Methanomicrobiales archaeon]
MTKILIIGDSLIESIGHFGIGEVRIIDASRTRGVSSRGSFRVSQWSIWKKSGEPEISILIVSSPLFLASEYWE